jgi:hypothetical protein
MTLVLNGSVGVSDVDGSAATPAIRGTDANTGIFFPAADTIAFAEGGAEVMRIDSAGNVGIGTASPTRRLDIAAPSASAALTSTTGTNAANFNFNNTGGLFSVGIDNSAGSGFGAGAYGRVIYSGGAYPLVMFTNDTERARIDSSGNFLFGKTVTTETVTGIAVNASIGQISCSSTSGADSAVFYRATTSAGNGVILTKSDIGGTNTLVGAGFANGTFGVVSDINKKKNVEDARSYLDDVMQLRVVKYNWNTDEDGSSKELGWIAQEVEQIFPGMVTEIEDSKLLKKEVFLPMMMKCIQELKAENDALKARVEALENV